MVSSEKTDGIDIVSFSIDRIDALNIDAIRPVILKLFETPYSKVVIDMSGINYLDSTAFAMFLYFLRIARSNYCTFRLCNLTENARDLFEFLRLDKSLEIYPDRDTCCESFRLSSPF